MCSAAMKVHMQMHKGNDLDRILIFLQEYWPHLEYGDNNSLNASELPNAISNTLNRENANSWNQNGDYSKMGKRPNFDREEWGRFLTELVKQRRSSGRGDRYTTN